MNRSDPLVDSKHAIELQPLTDGNQQSIDKGLENSANGSGGHVMITDAPSGGDGQKQNLLYYGVTESPPVSTALLFGFQQVMVCASGVIAMPLVVSAFICAEANPLARVNIIGTTLFTTGFSTIFQTSLGLRLPILQGPSAAFLPPIIMLMMQPENRCPSTSGPTNTSLPNVTSASANDEEWMSRMTLIQGGLITASLVQMAIGLTGLIGVITRYVGPLTIAPLMVCLEISLVDVVLQYASKHWMSIVVVALVILMAFCFSQLQVPLLAINFRQRKVYKITSPIFMLFPYILALLTTWLLCWIFTVTGVFNYTSDIHARTDTNLVIISDSPWFRVPYPGQWGLPKLSLAAFVGMAAATVGSVIESVGDYFACARVTHQVPPPTHAVNRGIFIEGFCCFLGGWLGGGASVTSYSENVGVIGITKVASRRTMQLAGLLFIVLGIVTKFGAILSTIPDPLVGGILMSSLAMVGGVGLSSVQLIDLRISRNMAILGLAIMFGIVIPKWIQKHPINLGVLQLDQMLSIVLNTSMIVGGVSGFIMDNVFPGATRSQRGFHHDSDVTKEIETETPLTGDVYCFSKRNMSILARIPMIKHMSIFPRTSKSK